MPDNCMPPVNVRSSELLYFERAAASGEYWNETRCRNCPGLRTPSIHANCCGHMSSEIVTTRSITTSQEVLAAAGIQTRVRSRDQSSRYFGVRFRPDLSKWVAEIRVAEWKAVDKKVWLGTFESEEGAARAVDAARKLLKCRKKRPANFPCDNLTKYSERIPSHLLLTDLTNDTMFKHVTQFVKKKSQEYAAKFNLEDIQALLSELPELRIAPQDPLDQTSYSQESIEDVLADQVDSQEDIKPCVMRTVSDESDYETTYSRRHSHSHSVSSVSQSWVAEDAGEGNCSLGIHQDIPIAKRLKREPMVMDEYTKFHPCNSTLDPLHSNYQCSDAEGLYSGEQEISMISSYFYELDATNADCTTWQADQPMAMNAELLFEWTDNQLMGAETSMICSSTVQPFTSSYIERESLDNISCSEVVYPFHPEEMMGLPSLPPGPAIIYADSYLNKSHSLQGDGTANYRCCQPDYYNYINLDNEHYPSSS